jgi:hypothetical protein
MRRKHIVERHTTSKILLQSVFDLVNLVYFDVFSLDALKNRVLFGRLVNLPDISTFSRFGIFH